MVSYSEDVSITGSGALTPSRPRRKRRDSTTPGRRSEAERRTRSAALRSPRRGRDSIAPAIQLAGQRLDSAGRDPLPWRAAILARENTRCDLRAMRLAHQFEDAA